MPKILEIEPTPNPNAKKFILKDSLTMGTSRSYDNANAASQDPLASQLFAIPHVTNVYYIDRWLTVTQDGQADWQMLMRQLAEPIRAAEPYASQPVVTNAAKGADDPETQGRLAAIEAILDDKIRPALQMDGGDLEVVYLQDKLLTVRYHGACGSCPSAFYGTLGAIEQLIHSLEPDLELMVI